MKLNQKKYFRLGGGRSAGWSVVRKKLLMNRYEERPDITRCEERARQRYDLSCRRCPNVRRLADRARRLIVPVRVRVRLRLGHEQNRQHGQGKREHPYPRNARILPTTHSTVIHYPNTGLDATAFLR